MSRSFVTGVSKQKRRVRDRVQVSFADTKCRMQTISALLLERLIFPLTPR